MPAATRTAFTLGELTTEHSDSKRDSAPFSRDRTASGDVWQPCGTVMWSGGKRGIHEHKGRVERAHGSARRSLVFFPFCLRFHGGTLRFDNNLMPHDHEHQYNSLYVSFPLARRRPAHTLFEGTGISGGPICPPAPSRTVAPRGTTNSARSAI